MNENEMIIMLGKAIEAATKNERNYDCLNDPTLVPLYVMGYLAYAGVTLTYDPSSDERLPDPPF